MVSTMAVTLAGIVAGTERVESLPSDGEQATITANDAAATNRLQILTGYETSDPSAPLRG